MKTFKTVLAATAVSILIAGCATTFKPWQLSEVKDGMSKEQIVQILGAPDYTVNKDGAEYLYYTYQEELPPPSEDMNNLKSLDRRAEEVSRIMQESKYEVVLVDGKMINYKELKK